MKMQFRMLDKQAEIIFGLVGDEIAANKNWLVSAVERGDMERAKEITKRVRELQDLFAAFNVPAKRDIAKHRGTAMETDILV